MSLVHSSQVNDNNEQHIRILITQILIYFTCENNIILYKKYSPAFCGLKTSDGIEKDSKKIVDILAEHYEKYFPLPEIDLNNTHHFKALEAYKQISYTPNIPLDQISTEEVIKEWKKFKPKKSLDSINKHFSFFLKKSSL
jgi:hypothetical protein